MGCRCSVSGSPCRRPQDHLLSNADAVDEPLTISVNDSFTLPDDVSIAHSFLVGVAVFYAEFIANALPDAQLHVIALCVGIIKPIRHADFVIIAIPDAQRHCDAVSVKQWLPGTVDIPDYDELSKPVNERFAECQPE